MFIEKLTKQQLDQFFHHDTYSFMDKEYYGREYLYLSYSTDSTCINNRLYDFEGSTVASEVKWMKFLYGIFGEEYINAYKQWRDNETLKNIKEIIND